MNDDRLTEPLPVENVARSWGAILGRGSTAFVGMNEAVELALATWDDGTKVSGIVVGVAGPAAVRARWVAGPQ